MENFKNLPKNNLGLYRLKNFVGRTTELTQLKLWLNHYPVVAITGPSGAGKSTLATALAVSEAARFKEGILWISAMGDTTFNFYDIVRDVDDVLLMGITTQPVSLWPILVLQKLYGFKRLVILDELADADDDTIEKIISMIGQIRLGAPGRFILIGRYLPERLIDLVGEANLVLGGVDETAVEAWIEAHHDDYPLTTRDTNLLYRLTGGHPLALKLIAALWNTSAWAELIDLISVQKLDDWSARLKATVTVSLAFVRQKYPIAFQLLTRCSRASGGFSSEAISQLYWVGMLSDIPLVTVIQTLLKHGLIMYNLQDNRYFIHPLIRRHLAGTAYVNLPPTLQYQYATDHARYYLAIVQAYIKIPPHQQHVIDKEWGNIRKVLDFLVDLFEDALDEPLTQTLTSVDKVNFPLLPTDLDDVLILIRDYTLALRTYIFWRHPPHARRWMLAGIIAARNLANRRTEALISLTLMALFYFHQDYRIARIWCQHSLLLFKSMQEYPRIIHCLKDLSTILKAQGDFEEALTISLEALKIATEHSSMTDQIAIQATIASIYYHKGNYEKAIETYNQILSSDLTIQNQPWLATYYNNLGLALEANGNYNGAIEHYKKAAILYKKLNDEKGLSTTYGNLGAVCYQIGHIEQALKWYKENIAIVERLGNQFDLAATLHNIAHVALDLDEFKVAAEYFERSRDIYRLFGQDDLAEEEQVLLDTLTDRRTIIG